MLKSKAVNVREIDQIGPPPRQDRRHLQLLVRCFPLFLRQIHAHGLALSANEAVAAKTFSRAFALLTDNRIAKTLRSELIDLAALMPAECAESSITRIRNAYLHQMPRLNQAGL